MPETEGIPLPAIRPVKPVWWWFVIHGALALAFGIFTLVTPFSDEPGFLVDGHAFALLAFIGGIQVSLQAILSRPFATGWIVLLVAGLHAVVAGVITWAFASAGMPTTLFWCVFGFLILEGALLLFGLLRSPVFRMWGILMGSCMMAAAVIMSVAWLADPEHSYDIPDAGMGVSGLLYGVAVLVAALQARTVYYRDGQTLRA